MAEKTISGINDAMVCPFCGQIIESLYTHQCEICCDPDHAIPHTCTNINCQAHMTLAKAIVNIVTPITP